MVARAAHPAVLVAALVLGTGCGGEVVSDCVTEVLRVSVAGLGDGAPIPGARAEIVTAGGSVAEERPCGGPEGCVFSGRHGLWAVSVSAEGFASASLVVRVPLGDDGVPEGQYVDFELGGTSPQPEWSASSGPLTPRGPCQ